MTLGGGAAGPAVAAALVAARGRVSLLCASDGSIRWASPSVARLLGWDPEALVGTSLFDLYEPGSRAYSERGFAQAAREPAASAEQLGGVARTARVRCADGTVTTVEAYPTSLLHDPTVEGILIEWIPVSERRWLVQAIDAVALGRPVDETLAAIVELIESLLVGVTAGVVAVDPSGWRVERSPDHRGAAPLEALLPAPGNPVWQQDFVLLDPSPAAAAWAGDDRGVGLSPLWTAQGDLVGAIVLVRTRADRLPIVTTGGENLYDVARHMAVLSLAARRRDVDQRAAAELDPLTGLTNRAGFDRAVAELLAAVDTGVAVVFLDLDDFKVVNDTQGHAVGDEVLRRFAARLAGVLRAGDRACRVGGDEFVVLCEGRWDPTAATALGRRIDRAVNTAAELPGAPRVRASLGVAAGPAGTLHALLATADQRLYEAKRHRRAQLVAAAAVPVP